MNCEKHEIHEKEFLCFLFFPQLKNIAAINKQ